jgi:hypothetical protein
MTTILEPRLDIAFKSQNKKANRKPLSPIRQHWRHFIDYYAEKIDAKVYEYLLTEIDPRLASRYDDCYVPHRGESDGFKDCHYYMQTVFPHIFSVDTKGWGSDCSFLPVGTGGKDVFPEFQNRIDRNESFFTQPTKKGLDKFDIFFAGQLPHDKNVQDQSDVGVVDALKKTIKYANENGLSVITKVHPILKAGYGVHCKRSDASIHDLLAACQGVVTVNSGVGLEAVLHEKPVYAFGKANYSEITAPSLDAVFDHKPDYKGFFNAWYSKHEDYTAV